VVPLVERLVDAYGDKLRVVYRHFPLVSIHDKAVITAEASEAAGAQGAFWEMHDLLYERQQAWASMPVDEMPELLSGYAEELGLDTEAFDEALASGAYTDEIMTAYNDAGAAGLGGTPSFVASGVHYPSQQWGLSYQGLAAFVQMMAMKERQFDAPPPQVIEEGKQYEAVIETEKGDIVIELYADQTPVSVNSFAYLADQGWYDDTIFHRVIPGFMAQTGDPSATGIGWPGYRCSDELDPELTFDGPGVLGMANSGPDTNGSQFFITLDAQSHLDGRHTVFGRVIEGMDVVEALGARDPQAVSPDEPGDRVLTITVEEK
jgi:cyclophilin family peptidyl-prolyl cis-trans isomerase